jgi:hypothetical protein
VCIHFREPLRTITPLIPFRHPNLTVTVERPEALATELFRGPAARAG